MNRAGLSGTLIAVFLTGMYSAVPVNAQPSQNSGFGVGPVDKGLVEGSIVGVAAVAGITLTYFILRNRGVVTGCIAEAEGKRTLVGSDQKLYALAETGQSPPVGERVKVKGHKSGPSSAPSLEIKKVLKDYGHCPT